MSRRKSKDNPAQVQDQIRFFNQSESPGNAAAASMIERRTLM
jgi:hypothetical protein